jgi:hypothetical protein
MSSSHPLRTLAANVRFSTHSRRERNSYNRGVDNGDPGKQSMGFALGGCLVSFLVWLVAALLLLGTQAGIASRSVHPKATGPASQSFWARSASISLAYSLLRALKYGPRTEGCTSPQESGAAQECWRYRYSAHSRRYSLSRLSY